MLEGSPVPSLPVGRLVGFFFEGWWVASGWLGGLPPMVHPGWVVDAFGVGSGVGVGPPVGASGVSDAVGFGFVGWAGRGCDGLMLVSVGVVVFRQVCVCRMRNGWWW
jgi:hypothetical protein